MDARDWLILKIIDEERSLRKTARRLFISQPSLTYRLNKLEREFDTILLKRHSNGISFTPQGEYILKYVNEMLERLTDVKKHVQGMNGLVSGTVRLGISTVFAKYKLASILKGYTNRFPHVNVILKTGSSTLELPDMLKNQRVDLIICRGDVEWKGKKHVILEEPRGIVSAKPVNIDKIYLEPWIQDEDFIAKEFNKLFYNWLEKHFPSNPQIKIIRVNSIEACIEMVSQGLGWTFLPKIHVQNRRNLCFYPLTWLDGKQLKWKTVMLYRNEVLKEQAVKKFIDYILMECKNF